jgi:hypothetical protein
MLFFYFTQLSAMKPANGYKRGFSAHSPRLLVEELVAALSSSPSATTVSPCAAVWPLPPVLLLHGAADEVAPVSQSTWMTQALQNISAERVNCGLPLPQHRARMVAVPAGRHSDFLFQWLLQAGRIGEPVECPMASAVLEFMNMKGD